MSEHETDIHQDIQENLEILTRVPRLGGPIGRLAGALDRVLLTLAVIALVGLSLTVLLQVASRLFLPITLSWTEELTRYLFIYMVAMGAGVVQHLAGLLSPRGHSGPLWAALDRSRVRAAPGRVRAVCNARHVQWVDDGRVRHTDQA